MFPPEIIDHVLSFLQRDHATLKFCALAHPSLSSLVKKHFYRHVTVRNFDPYPAGSYHPSNLLKLFVDKPNIANYVRSLRIHVQFSRDYRALESILPMVTQLRVISLACTTYVAWDDLSESFRIALQIVLRLPALAYVESARFDGFPLSALDQSSSLKGVSLVGNVSYLPPSVPHVYPPLDFLDVCYCAPSSKEIITTWVESRSFAVRSLKLGGSDLYQFSRLLGVCANTLTTLHIYVPFDYYNIPAISLSLSNLPHLARLTVQTPIIFKFGWNIRSCLPATMHIINTLPSSPTNLVHLIISIEIWIYNTSNTLSDMDWSPIVSFPYFDVIPRVELRVHARKLGKKIPSVELLREIKQDPQLMQLEMHRSFVINAVEELDNGWFGLIDGFSSATY